MCSTRCTASWCATCARAGWRVAAPAPARLEPEDVLAEVPRLVVRDVREVRVAVAGHRLLLRPMDADAVADGPDGFDVGAVFRIDLDAGPKELELGLRRGDALDVARDTYRL